MKVIVIICEGKTEVEFCKLLNTYLGYNEYRIEAINLGGNCNWIRVKSFIEKSLKSNRSALVTTMIDYYGRKEKTFPKQAEVVRINDKREKITLLENAMADEIDYSLRNRFVPYLQLHEFEAMLFNNIEVFRRNFEENTEYDKQEIEKILEDFPDPEMINEGKATSPSHRLKWIIPIYNKIVYGNLLVESIGLDNIYTKNRHFKEWIDKIIRFKPS